MLQTLKEFKIMIRTAVVGATGYSGVELLRLLHSHPYVKVCKITSGSQEGRQMAGVFPHLTSINHQVLTSFSPQQLVGEVDLVFFATPSGVSTKYIPEIVDLGIKCIDLSGDFRLNYPADYLKWYKHTPPESKYLNRAVYGLTEIFAVDIKTADIVANPGCYPTASLLGIIPAVLAGLIEPGSIIIDGKSGVSGSGRGLSLNAHFSEVNENLKAYKIGVHQHIPEIEQILEKVTKKQSDITFTTHLIPLTRGMMCTIYARLNKQVSTEEVVKYYQEYYKDHAFVRVRPAGTLPAVKEVAGSNYCDIGLVADQRSGSLIIISVIDNLVKGAAGQALQNMNLIFGWDQTTGLTNIPMYP